MAERQTNRAAIEVLNKHAAMNPNIDRERIAAFEERRNQANRRRNQRRREEAREIRTAQAEALAQDREQFNRLDSLANLDILRSKHSYLTDRQFVAWIQRQYPRWLRRAL